MNWSQNSYNESKSQINRLYATQFHLSRAMHVQNNPIPISGWGKQGGILKWGRESESDICLLPWCCDVSQWRVCIQTQAMHLGCRMVCCLSNTALQCFSKSDVKDEGQIMHSNWSLFTRWQSSTDPTAVIDCSLAPWTWFLSSLSCSLSL